MSDCWVIWKSSSGVRWLQVHLFLNYFKIFAFVCDSCLWKSPGHCLVILFTSQTLWSKSSFCKQSYQVDCIDFSDSLQMLLSKFTWPFDFAKAFHCTSRTTKSVIDLFHNQKSPPHQKYLISYFKQQECLGMLHNWNLLNFSRALRDPKISQTSSPERQRFCFKASHHVFWINCFMNYFYKRKYFSPWPARRSFGLILSYWRCLYLKINVCLLRSFNYYQQGKISRILKIKYF